MQFIVPQEIVLRGIPVQLFEFRHQLTAYIARRFAFFHFAQHVEVPPVQRPETAQLFPAPGRGGMRLHAVFFPLPPVLPLRAELPDIPVYHAALRLDALCNAPGDVFFPQRP